MTRSDLDSDMLEFLRSLPTRQQPSGIPEPPVIKSELKFITENKTPTQIGEPRGLAGTTKSNAITNAIGIR